MAEIVLGDTYLPYQLCRCVFFFVAGGNSFWLHRLVFSLWREKVLVVTSLPTIIRSYFMPQLYCIDVFSTYLGEILDFVVVHWSFIFVSHVSRLIVEFI